MATVRRRPPEVSQRDIDNPDRSERFSAALRYRTRYSVSLLIDLEAELRTIFRNTSLRYRQNSTIEREFRAAARRCIDAYNTALINYSNELSRTLNVRLSRPPRLRPNLNRAR